MYRQIYTQDQVGALRKTIEDPQFPKSSVQVSSDGLITVETEGIVTTGSKLDVELKIPPELKQWLIDLRLLRNVPLAYLVPDPRLLPPESIRFFHVDPTFTDRLVDGAMAAGNFGGVDVTLSLDLLKGARDQVDLELEGLYDDARLALEGTQRICWSPADNVMTGMLIRSELVRRWPGMIIRAYLDDWDDQDDLERSADHTSIQLPLLRRDLLSSNLMIVLFPHEPKRVEIREPFHGTRFGVEPVNVSVSAPPYVINLRDMTGNYVCNADGKPVLIDVTLKNAGRTLDISALGKQVSTQFTEIDTREHGGGASRYSPPSSKWVALNLEQLPYVQVFKADTNENTGSDHPGSLGTPKSIKIKGREVSLKELTLRMMAQSTQGGSK